MTPILILAAGQSARMGGRDKLLEEVDGMPLLRRQALMALSVGPPVYVALPAATGARAQIIADLPAIPIAVQDADDGLAATMRTVVAALPPVDAFMIMLADLVKLEASDLQMILQARVDHPDNLIWRGATEDRRPGHPVLFDASLRAEFSQLSGDHGAASLIRTHQHRVRLVPLPADRARYDLDTPEDWAKWRAANTALKR